MKIDFYNLDQVVWAALDTARRFPNNRVYVVRFANEEHFTIGIQKNRYATLDFAHELMGAQVFWASDGTMN